MGGSGDYIFGTALQYERQITDSASAALRLEYLGISVSSSDGSKADITGFSAEGHGRYYPAQNILFFDGMLGYANFTFIDPEVHSVSHYFKIGAKIGWRIDFGKPGGLVLEPFFGFDWAIGKTNIWSSEGKNYGFFDTDRLYDYIVKGFVVAGPQYGLGLGYRF